MNDQTENQDLEATEMDGKVEATETAEQAPPQNQEPSDGEVIEKLTAETQELNDKLLRSMAEIENTRRIAAREKQDASKYALTNFARDILRVADNLGFAMMSVSEDARKADPNLDNLFVGIDMTMKELLNVFGSHGIKPVAGEGHPFDHNIHEAVQQAEDASVPANTVMKMLRGGYTIQDRLLRPAQVIVSTGGPKEEPAQDDQEQPLNLESQEPGQKIDQET